MPATNSGGRQPGAGHPPGARVPAAAAPRPGSRSRVTHAPTPRAQGQNEGITSHDPQLLRVIRMRAQGMGYMAIAAALDPPRDWATIKRWVLRYPEVVDQVVEELIPRALIAPLVPAAVAVQRRILEPDPQDPTDPRIASQELQASVARDVLDRHGGKPRILTEARVQAGVVIRIVHAPDPTTTIEGAARVLPPDP